MALASRKNTWTGFLPCFNDCMGGRSTRAQELDWPSVAALWIGTAARLRPTADPAKAQRSSSCCPSITNTRANPPRRHEFERTSLDPDGGGRRGRSLVGEGSVDRVRAG